ncbi:MAG TPA: glycosyltransferase [Tepidisphaeraceae bacterium]|nr:glycosyltransferase [Tepidisphaeraceae bacterium]
MNEPEISLIVPTLNEADNLRELTTRIVQALQGRTFEILLVDDNSKDSTPQICEELSRTYPLHLLVRKIPKDGLGGAVLHGIAQARGKYLVVMDADLQHPPEKLPELIAPLEKGEAEFALGSRHVAGGSVGKRWGAFRKLNSDVATLLARPFAGKITDPMSGFFALKRDTYNRAQRLAPLGYKIGLELMCKCRVSNVREVPIHFAERAHGQSKLSMREQFRYLEHLSRLYDFCYPRLSPILKFLIVTLLSWIVGLGVYLAAVKSDAGPALSPVIGYFGAIFVTAVFHRRYIRSQREFLLTTRPWAEFMMVALAEIAVCAIVSIWIVRRVDRASAAELFIISFGAATFTRYVLRKELMLDIRGLRRDLRKEELS